MSLQLAEFIKKIKFTFNFRPRLILNILKAYVRMRDLYTNPSKTKQIESFEIFGLTKRIHETNLWTTGLQNESTVRIFQKHVYETNPQSESLRFGFANPPAWIRKDSYSWGFVGFVKTARIFGSSGHETNPRFESLRIGLTNPDLQICEVRIRDMIRKESFWSQDLWLRYETNPWICKTNPRFYKSLIRFPHPYYWVMEW
jgi:hypothetical protein